jgi:hypothetical protein
MDTTDLGKNPLPWPTFVALDIHDIQPIPA